jgi:hypothetical protein
MRQEVVVLYKTKENGMKFGGVILGMGLAAFLSIAGCIAVVEQPSEVAVVESDRRGPPAWAPAHGWRRKQETYYYYPTTQVYYYPSVGRYYWFEGSQWRYGDRLPRSFIIDEDKRIALDLDYEPHTQHAKIANSYPRDYYERVNRKGRGW